MGSRERNLRGVPGFWERESGPGFSEPGTLPKLLSLAIWNRAPYS